jgi:hypothetical protein
MNEVHNTEKKEKKSRLLLGLNPGFLHDCAGSIPLRHKGKLNRVMSFLALNKNDKRRQQNKKF